MKKSQDFETKIKRIEDIIELLDTGDLPIEEMLKIYEEGMKLTAESKDFLTNAETKIINISKSYNKDNWYNNGCPLNIYGQPFYQEFLF